MSANLQAAGTDAGEVLAKPTSSSPSLKKLVIAIHGIGDQYQYATIQSVVTRFGEHFSFPAATPLGAFHAPEGSLNAFRLKGPPSPPSDLEGIGFMEVYWAHIPRGVHKSGFTIEESKAWARTVVQRVRARFGDEFSKDFQMGGDDFGRAADVLEEMIETLRVLGNLTYLAEKAGLLKFDLDELLTNFLGDVQIVADFGKHRFEILKHFHTILDSVWHSVLEHQVEKPEIYIVAHSEGTVISFMALLQAMSLPVEGEPAPPPRPAWIDHVRGFMTIGSPIDKHIVLWPEIWRAFKLPSKAPASGPIRWRNYYDYGDPIGFELDTTRDWMQDHGWTVAGAFEFREKSDDMGFTRYLLPGAAHNEYWNDKAVFGHFIQNVMGLKPPEDGHDYSEPPPTRWGAAIGSYTIPYLLALGILYAGVYLLVKGLARHLPGVMGIQGGTFPFIKHVAGATLLIAGITVAVRIPRLTRLWFWRIVGWVLFAASIPLACAVMVGSAVQFFAVKQFGPYVVVACLSALVSVVATMLSRLKGLPDGIAPFFKGMRPLLITGGVIIALLVLLQPDQARSTEETLLPLLLSGAAFLYLWWLAAMVFDLVFVWHRYVRGAALETRLRGYRPRRKKREIIAELARGAGRKILQHTP